MSQDSPDFFVQSELVCTASKNITPELSSGVYVEDIGLFYQEKQKLKEILHACEQYSNR